MGEASQQMLASRQGGLRFAACASLLLAACAQAPIKPSTAHIRAEDPPPAGTIPAPVRIAPALPAPKPSARPETYSVVVNNIRVQELLFALARDARLNVDIHPGVSGNVTLNAIDQTLPQLLTRIARQVDMRYEIDGPNLIVLRDTPFLRTYRVDYVNLARNTTILASVSAQVSAVGPAGAGAAASAQNNSTATITSDSKNRFWETLVQNIKDILRETDKVIPKTTTPGAPAGAAPAGAAAPAAGAPAAPAAAAAPGAAGAAAAAAPQLVAQPIEYLESASVIANAETGVLSIRATSRQHEKVQEFLDQVMASARRQVLLEATIAEVNLGNEYQRGIDWSRVRRGASGVSLSGSRDPARTSTVAPPLGIDTSSFIIDAAVASVGLQATIRLLETFGTVRVLSSPKVSVLNNQTAVLKVTNNIVYFTVQAQTTAAANAPSVTTFNTTPATVPVGFVMTVMPQISETDSVSLSVRPSITRFLRFVPDPNPSLVLVQNLVPETQTREMESVLRLQSGQIAVLGGLMLDEVRSNEDTIPWVRDLPGVGQIFSQRRDSSQKTELVIFLRASVIRDSSLEGDYARFRDLVPGADYFTRPNPAREARPR
jgi:general secretion pathway protein D